MRIDGSEHLNSIKQAISMVSLRNAMNQDARSVDRILQSLEEMDAARAENQARTTSVQQSLGASVDTRA